MYKHQKRPAALQKVTNFFGRLGRKNSKICSLEEAKGRIDGVLDRLDETSNFYDENTLDSLTTLEVIARNLIGIKGEEDVPDGQIALYLSRSRSVAEYLSQKKYTELYIKISNSFQDDLNDSQKRLQALLRLNILFNGFRNYSNECSALARQFGQLKGVVALLRFVTTIKAIGNVFEESNRILVGASYQASLGILHNCIRLHKDNRAAYRRANAVDILTRLPQTVDTQSEENFQPLVMLILAYIVDEHESEALDKSEDCVRKLTNLLKDAVKCDGHFAVTNDGYSTIAFSALELLDGLNQLTVNDANKAAIERSGGVPAIVKMLQPDFSEEEQQVAIEALWKLAFVDSIKNNNEVLASVNVLHSLTTSRNESIRQASSYALWEIQDNQRQVEFAGISDQPPSYQECVGKDTPNQSSGHVMISYQWDSQTRAIYIRDKLTQAGYNVWVDLDSMRGDILAAMAEAVERSDVILMCMSEKYKDSSSCRSEASYASKKKKGIIPILMEAGYEPDGWLGILLGTKLYFKFCSDDEMKTNMDGLIKEIGQRGRSPGHTAVDDVDGPLTSCTEHVTAASPPTRDVIETPDSNASEWQKERVQSWLEEIGLSKLCSQLDFCDGTHLKEMYEQYKQSPDNFRSEIKDDLQLNFRELLKFTTALGQLFKSV